MSDSTFSRAWSWSVVHSPLVNAWRWVRWMGYPNRKAFALLEAAGLPERADGLIRQTVIKSKLWANERAEIARELIAHVQDAIEAGRSDDEIAEAFGDPKRIAKLMRRSMKRKRPLYWRAYRNMKRATAAMLLMVVVGYGSLAARFYMGSPSIKRNYIAELNAQNDEYSEDQKAWRVYHDADVQWQRHIQSTLENQRVSHQGRQEAWYEDQMTAEPEHEPVELLRPGLELYPKDDDFTPRHPDYEQTVALAKAFEPELAKVREAAMRPIIGLPFSYNIETVEIEPGIWEDQYTPPAPNPEDQESLIHVLLPHLGQMRQFVKRLAVDAQWAIEEGDSQRAVEDYLAIAGMTRQCLKDGFLISDLVGFACLQTGQRGLKEQLLEHPEAFTQEQLASIAHVYSLAGQELGIHMVNERQMFDDILQRAYTDDGHGNGRITPTGHEMILSFGFDYNGKQNDVFGMSMQKLAQPFGFVAGDRKSQHDQYYGVIDRIDQVTAEGPASLWLLDLMEIQAAENHARFGSYFLSATDVMLPALSHAAYKLFESQIQNDAAITMLAIETYRRAHGQLPSSLDELSPRYLPEVPSDPFNPGHPIQYKVDETGYIIYVAGSDGDLDDGFEPDPDDQDRKSFGQRFVVSYVFQEDRNGGMTQVVERDRQGQVVHGDPQGPDSDWVLIDMRSQASGD